MARGTCTSNNSTGSETGGGVNTRVKVLDRIAEEVRERFGVGVWFAEVLGRRWSFIAGEMNEELFFPPKKVRLGSLGVVIECDEDERVEEIVSFITSRLKEAEK